MRGPALVQDFYIGTRVHVDRVVQPEGVDMSRSIFVQFVRDGTALHPRYALLTLCINGIISKYRRLSYLTAGQVMSHPQPYQLRMQADPPLCTIQGPHLSFAPSCASCCWPLVQGQPSPWFPVHCMQVISQPLYFLVLACMH